MPILLGNQAVSGVSEVWADDPPKAAEKSAHAAITADAATQAAFATFLHDYHQALVSSSSGFLTAHTNFPLPFAEIEYDAETKTKHRKIATVAKLLKSREALTWPSELVPKGPEDLAKLRRGTQKCNDPKHADKPNFAQGDPAITLQESSATLTYLAEPCAAETHMVTLVFARVGETWHLRERTVRNGIK